MDAIIKITEEKNKKLIQEADSLNIIDFFEQRKNTIANQLLLITK